MKKFLSLVLALVMTMSLVTISAGAKDFTDAADITYDEAVAVMSTVGIIDGDTDGSFRPNGNLTRGAAAKIVCNMILGPTKAGALSTVEAPFKDVPADHVFSGYIAYCVSEGIVSGYTDGTFKPSAPLTGYAFMKMLLTALGYDADIEGYNGANFAVNVAKRALNIGLDDDLATEFVGSKTVTREEALLYAFNAMQATMVEYENTSSITIGDVVITNNSVAKEMTNSSKTDGYIDEDGKLQFAEKYFTKLSISEKTSDQVDAFGRPATTWIYDKEDIGTFADEADATLVINQPRTWAEAMMGTDYFDYKAADITADVELFINGDATVIAGGDIFEQGDVVEVFENDDGDVVTVAVTRYTYAKIDEIDDDLAKGLVQDGATYAIDLIDENDASLGYTYYDDYDDEAYILAGFNAETYVEDAVIAIAMNQAGEILDSHIAELVTGTVTKYKTGDKAALTVDGTAYLLNGSAYALHGSASAIIIYDEATYGLYLDKNGYAIAYDTVSTAQLDDVYYVTGVVADGTGLYNTTSYYAQAVKLTDGTVEEIKLETVSFSVLAGEPITYDGTNWKVDGTNAGTNTYAGAQTDMLSNIAGYNTLIPVQGLYTFTDKDGNELESKSGNGKNTAEAYNHAADSAYYVRFADDLTDDLAREDVALVLNTNNGGDSGTKKAYIDAETQFIKVEDDGSDIEVKVVKGATSVDNSYLTKAITVTVKEGANYVAKYVVLAATDFETGAADADILYIKSASSTKLAKDEYETSVVLMDGTGTSKKVVTDIAGSSRNFYTYTIDDDGIYELTAINSNATYAAWADKAANFTYDDESGYILSATLTGLKDNTLTGTASFKPSATTYTLTLEDVAFSDKVVIMDSRSASTREGDVYTAEITSIAKLQAAIAKTGTTVTANIYVEDGEILLVNVLASALGTPSSPVITGTTEVAVDDRYADFYEAAGITTAAVDGEMTFGYKYADLAAYVNNPAYAALVAQMKGDAGLGMDNYLFTGVSLKAPSADAVKIAWEITGSDTASGTASVTDGVYSKWFSFAEWDAGTSTWAVDVTDAEWTLTFTWLKADGTTAIGEEQEMVIVRDVKLA